LTNFKHGGALVHAAEADLSVSDTIFFNNYIDLLQSPASVKSITVFCLGWILSGEPAI